MSDVIYGFGNDDARALKLLIRNTGTSCGRGSRDTSQHFLLAVATSGVPARVGTTLGSADVTIKHLDYSGTNVVILDSGYTIKAFNLAGTAVTVGAYVIIHQLNTFWVVVWEECPP